MAEGGEEIGLDRLGEHDDDDGDDDDANEETHLMQQTSTSTPFRSGDHTSHYQNHSHIDEDVKKS